jgi:hypothetical protein
MNNSFHRKISSLSIQYKDFLSGLQRVMILIAAAVLERCAKHRRVVLFFLDLSVMFILRHLSSSVHLETISEL